MIIKAVNLYLISILVLYLSCTDKLRVSPSQTDGKYECIELLKKYQHYWVDDSIGKNGFRELFSEMVLRNCKFSGTRWSNVSEYLGKPNFTFINNSSTHYRYRLNNFTSDLGAPGNMFLEVFVKDDIITSFKVDMVDG